MHGEGIACRDALCARLGGVRRVKSVIITKINNYTIFFKGGVINLNSEVANNSGYIYFRKGNRDFNFSGKHIVIIKTTR